MNKRFAIPRQNFVAHVKIDFFAQSLFSVFWEHFESSHVDVVGRLPVTESHCDGLSLFVSDAGGGH